MSKKIKNIKLSWFSSDNDIIVCMGTKDNNSLSFTSEAAAHDFAVRYWQKYYDDLGSMCHNLMNEDSKAQYTYSIPCTNKVTNKSTGKNEWRPIVCYPKLGYFLFHIPKTCGRYISNNFKIFKSSEHHGGGHPTFNIAHTEINHLNLMDKRSFYPQAGIAVLRNPYSWLSSFFFTNNSEGFVHFKKDYSSLTFEKFIESICLENDIGKQINKNIYPLSDGIFSTLFDKNKVLQIRNFIFFENFESGLARFDIQKKVEPYWKYFNDPRLSEIRKPSVISDYRTLYNNRMIEMVAEKFKQDIDFGGYNFDGLIDSRVYDIKNSEPPECLDVLI